MYNGPFDKYAGRVYKLLIFLPHNSEIVERQLIFDLIRYVNVQTYPGSNLYKLLECENGASKLGLST